MWRGIERGLEWLLEFVAPSCCGACGDPSRALFCPACGTPPDATLESLSGGVPLIAAGPYVSPLKEAIGRFKYGSCPELATRLSQLLLPKLGDLGLVRGDAFVPVPLHRARLVERGYDQSALLARALARAHGARFLPRLLSRDKETAQQATLDRRARADNVCGAFRVRQAWGSGRVVLVDDVVTTGATVRACFGALAEAGVTVLAVAAIARAGSAILHQNGGDTAVGLG
ncbi:MAG TPA: ComF family protein [Polyangiaceae bacterium]|jgi:ComF family protein|nr:ComF family protein [Polyangiaceae bacterium]